MICERTTAIGSVADDRGAPRGGVQRSGGRRVERQIPSVLSGRPTPFCTKTHQNQLNKEFRSFSV